MGLFGLRGGDKKENSYPGFTKKESNIVKNQKQSMELEKLRKEHDKHMETILQLQKELDEHTGPLTFAQAYKETGWRNPTSYILGIIIAENMILSGTASDESEHFRKTTLEKLCQSISIQYSVNWKLKTFVISEFRQNLSYTSLLESNPKSVSDMKKLVKKRAMVFVDHIKLSADYQKLFEAFMVRYPPEKILQAGMGNFISHSASIQGCSAQETITMLFDLNEERQNGKLEKEKESFLAMFWSAVEGCDDVSQISLQRSVDIQERFFNDFFKLYDLLIEENVILSLSMFITILVSSVYDSHAKKLEQDILGEDPKNISDYIHAFLIHYPVEKDRLRLLPQFRAMLNQNNISLPADLSIEKQIRLAEKKLQRDSFKKSLLAGEPSKTMLDLDVLTGIEFEHFLVKIFEKMGYKCEVTKASGDFGADLLLNKVGVRTVVQAKRYDDKVSPKAVQEAVAAIRQYDADDAMVVTTNYFTKGANELADNNNVKLVDRDKIEKWLKQYQI